MLCDSCFVGTFILKPVYPEPCLPKACEHRDASMGAVCTDSTVFMGLFSCEHAFESDHTVFQQVTTLLGSAPKLDTLRPEPASRGFSSLSTGSRSSWARHWARFELETPRPHLQFPTLQLSFNSFASTSLGRTCEDSSEFRGLEGRGVGVICPATVANFFQRLRAGGLGPSYTEIMRACGNPAPSHARTNQDRMHEVASQHL